MLFSGQQPERAMPTSSPLISCLCVTRGRVALLSRALACFRSQTWQNKEFVLLYESDDAETAAYAATLAGDPQIRCVEVPVSPKLPLGALRNLSIKAASGEYIAQWDDDDWSGPARLAVQMDAIQKHQRPACVLVRWTMYDAVERLAYVSGQRAWEGSLLARRDVVPPYPELRIAEDTPSVQAMLRDRLLVGLDFPELYIYTFHGTNTWDLHHWKEELLPWCQPLGARELEDIEKALGVTAEPGPASSPLPREPSKLGAHEAAEQQEAR